MTFTFPIINSEAPDLKIYIKVPPVKADEVQTNDEAAINLARALTAKYEIIDAKTGLYHRINDGLKFFVNFEEKDVAVDQIIKDFCLHGTYEPNTTKLIKEIVKEGDVCVDVGASIGYFTLQLARQVGPKGRVYSIESTHNQFPYLEKNISINGFTNVLPFNVAAWDTELGTEQFITINANANQVKQVKAVSLDAIVTEPVDFIKMDIDGSEPHALKGLTRTIEQSPNLKMIIEFYPAYIKKLGGNPQDVLDILDKYFTYSKIEGDFEGEKYWNYYCQRR